MQHAHVHVQCVSSRYDVIDDVVCDVIDEVIYDVIDEVMYECALHSIQILDTKLAT